MLYSLLFRGRFSQDQALCTLLVVQGVKKVCAVLACILCAQPECARHNTAALLESAYVAAFVEVMDEVPPPGEVFFFWSACALAV